MGLEVVNAHHGFLEPRRKPMGDTRAHQQGAARPGPSVTARRSMSFSGRPACSRQASSRGRIRSRWSARGQFRHHPTVDLVEVDLGVKCLWPKSVALGRPPPTVGLHLEQGHAGLVTGGFDAQHEALACGIRHGQSQFTFFAEKSSTHMPLVRPKENEPFEAAMRRFKRTIEKIGLLNELRAREFYEKPTAERKRKKAAAVKRHYKRVRSQMLPARKYKAFLAFGVTMAP